MASLVIFRENVRKEVETLVTIASATPGLLTFLLSCACATQVTPFLPFHSGGFGHISRDCTQSSGGRSGGGGGGGDDGDDDVNYR